MRLLSLVLTTALLVGSTPSAQAVVGPSHDASPGVTATLVMVLQRRGPAAGFCTGIVVSSRAVVTAAHCVPVGADFRIHFKDGNGSPVLMPVAGVSRHPGYRPDAIARRERSIDLAVLTLSEPLPDRFRPAVLSAQASARLGERFDIAGFGLGLEGEPTSSGQLREASLDTRAPLSTVLLWAEDPTHAGAGACTGDSGGPLLDGSGAVVALTLWSTGAGSHHCGALTQALWLAPYRDWIAAQADR